MIIRLKPVLPVVAVLALVACAPGAEDLSGAEIYRRNCVACHGNTGAGDGPLAGDLPVSPANLRGLSAANGGVFPQEEVMATIHGYRGKSSEGLMPEFGGLLAGPEVIWRAPDGREIPTPQALIALAEYLETLQDEVE